MPPSVEHAPRSPLRRHAGPKAVGAPAATLPLKRFNIPAGPLDEAIAAYEKATGLKVKVVLPEGTLAGFRSPGVVGLYREDEALRLILSGNRAELSRAGRDNDGCGCAGE